MKIEARPSEDQQRLLPFERFFAIPPSADDALEQAHKQLYGKKFQREKLAEVLISYNKDIGNDQACFDSLEVLKREGSGAIVTGQQLGLMGGPSYTILKAISCLKLAKSTNAVPIFWLATDDHDAREVDHTYLQDEKGNLKEYRLHLPQDGQSVESMQLSAYDHEMIALFLKETDQQALMGFFAQQNSYAKAMASFLAKIFRGTGLVFLEPKILRPLAKEFYARELKHTEKIQQILKATTQDFQNAGGKPLLKTEGTNLFSTQNQARLKKIVYKEGVYTLSKEPVALEVLLDLIDQTPECFSPNVVARPVMQSFVIPTLAYVAGPSEWNYHCQLKDLFDFHHVSMPWIVPRLELTFVTASAKEFLDALQLKPWEIFLSDVQLSREVLAGKGLPTSALHVLRNLLNPHQKPQSRVLNWCGFQRQTSENLVQALLHDSKVMPGTSHHYYCYLNRE